MREKSYKIVLWLVVFTLPALVVFGYETGQGHLTNILEGQAAMKPATYYCSFIMALLMLWRKKFVAFYLIIVCFHVLSAWVLNGMAPRFIPVYENELAFMTLSPGLPSWATMLSFSLIGLGAITRVRAYYLGAIAIGLFAFVGYLLRQDWMKFLVEDWSTAMAVNTSVVIICGASYLYAQEKNN